MAFSSNHPNLSSAEFGKNHRTHFQHVVVFDYDDGPASGLATYASGEGVRFISVGDSKSRLKRAFVLSHVRGKWNDAVEKQKRHAYLTDARVLLPRDDNLELKELERRVSSAAVIGDFVGIGRPSMEHLRVAPLSQVSKEKLISLAHTPSGFQLAERLARGSK